MSSVSTEQDNEESANREGLELRYLFVSLNVAQMMSSQLLNGTDNHKRLGIRGGGGGGGSGGAGGVGNRESYQLLNLTESDSDDGVLTRLEAGEGAGTPENVPDLNLMLPKEQLNKSRRKIRLKRLVSNPY